MKNPRNTKAVSEIIGTIFLLAIAVTSVSIIYIQVLGSLDPIDTTNVTIIGKIEEGRPVFELQRGESLGSDTKISITFAGLVKSEFLQHDIIGNQEWNIGGQIVLPPFNDRKIQVDATIVDTKTNSIVFVGLLQEGFIAKYRGGIWHFNEASWNGTPDEVIDSSGNNNHGIARGGATTTTNGISQNAGFFDGFNDVVKVNTAWTLDVTDSITVEAWMKPQDPKFIADIIGVSGSFGYYPYITSVIGNIYALVSEDKQKYCKLSTVEIDDEGIVIDCQNLTVGSSTANNLLQPKLIYMSKGLILLSYTDNNYYMHLKTFYISNSGSIKYTGYELVFNDYVCSRPNFPCLQKITDNICAMAYWVINVSKDSGIIKTVEVSSNGNIACIETKTYEPWYDPSLVHVNGQVYAIAYRNSLKRGILKTFTITPYGSITYTGKMVTFENVYAYEPSLVQVSYKVFAVAYRNNLDYGIVKTLNIYSNGSIALTGKMKVFENTNKFPCYTPCFINGQNDTYIIAYATAAPGADSAKGYVITLRLGQDGSISSNGQRKLFDGDAASYPTIIHIDNQLYAISYTGHQAHPGTLITMLIGPHGRGIYKGNSYELYANMTTVEGYINNVYVYYYNNLLGERWNHFALTYNGKNISLYVNGINVANTSYQNHRIDVTREPLYFGRFYSGYIDEIAIYDKALTKEQILYHFMHPGTFEYNS
jgi:hypothetical protein